MHILLCQRLLIFRFFRHNGGILGVAIYFALLFSFFQIILFSPVHRVTLVFTKCSYTKNHNGTHALLMFSDVFPKAMQSLSESFVDSLSAASLDTYRADDSDIKGALNLSCPGEL